MGGGLIQLVAYGVQDVHLTGNPQITFFKVVHRRHTNFSMAAIRQTFNEQPSAAGSTITSTISRNGDLLSRLWLDVKMPATTGNLSGTDKNLYIAWTNNTGHALVKECEIEIGGQRIDRHYSEWLDVWNELTDHENKEWIGLNKHDAKTSYLGHHTQTSIPAGLQLYIPLQFWFCLNPGLALPLIALQYHEVNVKITTRNLLELVNTDHTGGTDISVTDLTHFDLYADYIFLDTDERRRFAQVSHEYLIIQVQRSEGQSGQTSHELKFNHPVKELIWFSRDTDAGTGTITPAGKSNAIKNELAGKSITTFTTIDQNNDWFNYLTAYTDDGPTEIIGGDLETEAFGTMSLTINGHERFSARKASYFRLCQRLQAGHTVNKNHIYCYSFALKPEEHQPSGTCNFSRIDNAHMMFTNPNTSGPMTVFALNYNILHIMSGMGGLAYSN